MNIEEVKETLMSISFRPISWGYATKSIDGEDHLLVAVRTKKDDPGTYGMRVLPGGSVEDGENYEEAAVREVEEETGIETAVGARGRFSNLVSEPRYVDRRDTLGSVHPDGTIFVYYKKSGKGYAGQLIDLKIEGGMLSGIEETKLVGYIPTDMALMEKEQFTPALHLVLDIVDVQYNEVDIPGETIDDAELDQYLEQFKVV